MKNIINNFLFVPLALLLAAQAGTITTSIITYIIQSQIFKVFSHTSFLDHVLFFSTESTLIVTCITILTYGWIFVRIASFFKWEQLATFGAAGLFPFVICSPYAYSEYHHYRSLADIGGLLFLWIICLSMPLFTRNQWIQFITIIIFIFIIFFAESFFTLKSGGELGQISLYGLFSAIYACLFLKAIRPYFLQPAQRPWDVV